MSSWSWQLGDIPVRSLFSSCELALGFSIPTDDDFQTHVNAIDIYQRHITRKQRDEIFRTCITSVTCVKLSEDRIIPRLSVEKGGQVKLHFDTWLHGQRKSKYILPTKAIYKAHKANQVTKIKRILDTTNVSLEQIDSILGGLQG